MLFCSFGHILFFFFVIIRFVCAHCFPGVPEKEKTTFWSRENKNCFFDIECPNALKQMSQMKISSTNQPWKLVTCAFVGLLWMVSFVYGQQVSSHRHLRASGWV